MQQHNGVEAPESNVMTTNQVQKCYATTIGLPLTTQREMGPNGRPA